MGIMNPHETAYRHGIDPCGNDIPKTAEETIRWLEARIRKLEQREDQANAWELVFGALSQTPEYAEIAREAQHSGIAHALRTVARLVEHREQADAARDAEFHRSDSELAAAAERESRLMARVKELETEIVAVAGEDRIKVCEGTGLENIAASLAVTIAALRAANDGLKVENTQAHGEIARLERDLATMTNATNLATEQRDKAEAANAELETLLASEKATRNAIIAKGVATEQANAELAGALRDIRDKPDLSALGMRLVAKGVLARHAAGEPAKRPDTERLDWLFGHAHLEHHTPGVFSTGIVLTTRAEIDAARQEVQS